MIYCSYILLVAIPHWIAADNFWLSQAIKVFIVHLELAVRNALFRYTYIQLLRMRFLLKTTATHNLLLSKDAIEILLPALRLQMQVPLRG